MEDWHTSGWTCPEKAGDTVSSASRLSKEGTKAGLPDHDLCKGGRLDYTEVSSHVWPFKFIQAGNESSYSGFRAG